MMQRYRSMVDAAVQRWCDALPAQGLYEPMAYLMGLPAKRVRPVATLMACELFGGNAEQALEEAIGIELFHNFTLMHDDIMDASPLRRGDPTVHVKWNVNTAILSGDAMLVKAYELMGTSAEVFQLFNRIARLRRTATGHGFREARRCDRFRIHGNDTPEDSGAPGLCHGDRRLQSGRFPRGS